MSHIPWKSLRLFLDLDRQIDSAFDELIHKPWGRFQGDVWRPLVDVYETEDEYVVVADLPGVAPTELELTLTDNELAIRSKREVQSEIRRGQTVRVERERGEFYRRLWFDQAVDREQLESHFEHGQLVVRLVKRRQDRGSGHAHE